MQVRPAVAGQAQLEIRAERTNNTWQLTEPPSTAGLRTDTNSWLPFPAQAASIENLIVALEQLTPAVYISESELKSHSKADEEFGFTTPQASIVIMQGSYRVHVLIGARTNPGDQVYLQVVGIEGAYVVSADLLKHIPRSANDWRDTTVIYVGTASFDRIAVTNSSTALVRLVLQRDSTNRVWRIVWPLQARADNLRMQESLQKLQNLRVRQFVSDDPRTDLEPLGLAPAELELAIGQGTNMLALLQFGRSPTNDPGQVYARRFGQYSIFTVDKDSLSSWRAAVNDFRDSHLLNLPEPVDSIEVIGQDIFSLHHETNEVWRVLPDNLAADTTTVQDLLAVLTGAPIIGFVKDVVNPPDLVDFGLASPLRRFILSPKASNLSVISNEVCFGLSTNQPDKVFVKRTDESSVYALSTNDFARLPSAGWQLRERKLWHFSEDDIARVTIRQGGKTLQLLRNERYKWSIAPGSQGIIPNELALEDTVRGLVQASAVAWAAHGEPDGSGFGLHEKGLQITLELKNGDKATIEFGREAASTNRYAAVTLDGQVWVLEFPWMIYRDISSYLSISPGP